MKLDDYLLMIRKQARRGLATEIKCEVNLSEDGNVVTADSGKICATLKVRLRTEGTIFLSPDIKSNNQWVDIWGFEFGPEFTSAELVSV